MESLAQGSCEAPTSPLARREGPRATAETLLVRNSLSGAACYSVGSKHVVGLIPQTLPRRQKAKQPGTH